MDETLTEVSGGNGQVTTDTEVVTVAAHGVLTPEGPGPFPTRLHDKVCIVGFAESSRNEVPFAAEDVEFWGLNRLHAVLPDGRWHRWFQLHDPVQSHTEAEAQENLGWMRGQPFPVYLRAQDTHFGFGEAFPHQAVLDAFSGFAGARYFTNSVSWLIGLAICMGFAEIQVYGVDMAADQILNAEYSMQRPSCEYLLGVAEGRGIKVTVPPGSDLLKSMHLYGIEDPTPYVGKLLARLPELGARKNQMKQAIAKAQSDAAQATAQLQALDGAMSQCEYELRNWVPELTGDQLRQVKGEVNGDG